MSISSHAAGNPRDRLIATARSLFLQHGVPNVGINRVIAEAGIARMTLYNHFASKDDLVLAVFEQEAERRRVAITSTQDSLQEPGEQALAVFDVALDLAGLDSFRGCAFINLAVETAAPNGRLHALARKHKDWIRANLESCLSSDGFAEPECLADQILVLWDGGLVGAYVQQSDAPIRTARKAARALMRDAAP